MFPQIKLIIIGLILASVIGYIGWLKIQNLTQENEITTLSSKINTLQISNNSLAKRNENLMKSAEDAREQLIQNRKITNDYYSRINKLNKQINDRKEEERATAIARGKKSSLFVKRVNKAIACETEHQYSIARREGKCIIGKFVPNGERLVPLD